jgi:hypothetical protein
MKDTHFTIKNIQNAEDLVVYNKKNNWEYNKK